MLSSLQVYNDVDALDGNLDVDDDDNDEVQGVDWVWYAQPPSSNLAGRVVVTSQWQCISSAPISFALFALWGSLHLLFALWGSSQLVHWNSDAHWNTAGALAKWGTLGEAPCTLHWEKCTLHSAFCTLQCVGSRGVEDQPLRGLSALFRRLKIVGTFWICIFVDGGVEHPAL